MSERIDVLATLNEFAMRKQPFGDDNEAERKFHAAYDALTDLIQATRGWLWARENGCSEELAAEYVRAALARIAPNELHDKAAELRGRGE